MALTYRSASTPKCLRRARAASLRAAERERVAALSQTRRGWGPGALKEVGPREPRKRLRPARAASLRVAERERVAALSQTRRGWGPGALKEAGPREPQNRLRPARAASLRAAQRERARVGPHEPCLTSAAYRRAGCRRPPPNSACRRSRWTP